MGMADKENCGACARDVGKNAATGKTATHKVGNEGGPVTGYLNPRDKCPGSGSKR